MMRTLFIHIGLSKTGTSAIQSWLSLNNKELTKEGIDYADLSPTAKEGKITAGNGVALFNACSEANWVELESLILNVYFKRNKKAIISSETLQGISLESIKKIKEISDNNKIEVKIIAYVRSAYELIYSNYLQGVKRHGFDFLFGLKQRFSYKEQSDFLRNYHSVFGSNLSVINYDTEKGDIFRSLSRVIDFCDSKFIVKNTVVNRSLTMTESNTLRTLNGVHKGAFSTQLSDYILERTPNKKTSVYYDKKIIFTLQKNSGDDIDWINSTFFAQKEPLKLNLINDNDNDNDKSELDEVISLYRLVFEWCLDYLPKDEELVVFVNFLRDLAILTEDYSLVDSLALMKRARKFRPRGPLIERKCVHYENQLLMSLRALGVDITLFNGKKNEIS